MCIRDRDKLGAFANDKDVLAALLVNGEKMTSATTDLAITEAAVGAGITSILFFLTLKKIHAIDIQKGTDKTTNNVQEGVTRHGEDQE